MPERRERPVFRPSSVDEFLPDAVQRDAAPSPRLAVEGEPVAFPHLSERGEARMVDVSGKQVTARSATARGKVLLSAECVAALRDQSLPKGDALAVARIAAVMGAKRTSDLIPLCHPLPLTGVDVHLEVTDAGVEIEATARTTHRTGVEMEALTAVCTAALGLIDMVKAVDRHAVLTEVRIVAKSGGRSGDWREDERPTGEPQ